MKIFLDMVGCRLNQAELEQMARQFRAEGHTIVAAASQADAVVINTCSVTENADKDCRYAVHKTLRHSPHAFVAVTGCYAQTGAARSK